MKHGIHRSGRLPIIWTSGFLLACGQVGCSGSSESDIVAPEFGRLDEALTAQDAAINAKWEKLGGLATVGQSTSLVTTLPSGLQGQYQTFANGAIVSSDEFGAVYVTQAIFDKWLSLQSQVDSGGNNVLQVVGLPVSDSTVFGAGTAATFQGGQVINSSSGSYVSYGQVYITYTQQIATLGLPVSDELAGVVGGRFQLFEGGQIWWRGDLGAFAVRGEIFNHWTTLGGPTGTLGYPTSNTENIIDGGGNVIGTTGRFERGVIYQSPSTGAQALTGDIAVAYESKFGGPNGGLGLPVSEEATAASGDKFVDLQKGVIVNHTAPFGTAGIYAFSAFDFFIERFDSFGDDCALGVCGSQDPYWHLTLTDQTGLVMSGAWGNANNSDWEPDETWFLGNPSGDTAFTITFHGVDVDDTSSDDDLGTTTSTYDINNLWGMFEDNRHETSSSDGGVTGVYAIRNHPPFDPNDIIGTQWWSFDNFATPKLTYAQFSASFQDVASDESWTHPFNKLYFEIYEDMSANGNCYGMSLESIYAQQGRSPYAQPIFQYFPDTAGGVKLEANTPAHAALISHINIKHGYQLGANQIGWFVAALVSGATHDPVLNFGLGNSLHAAGEPTLVTLFDSYLFGGGHTVRAIGYETFGPSCSLAAPNCHRIHILDPNFPKEGGGGPDFIEIDPTQQAYRYRGYSGGLFTGGRMFVTPFRLLSHQQYTPGANPLQLLENGMLIVTGSTGRVSQVTDEQGRTLFEPGLTGLPTKWDDLRRDEAQRIPTLAPVPLAVEGPMDRQIFAGKRVVGATQAVDIGLATGLPTGTNYSVTLDSSRLSTHLSIPGTAGVPDRVEAFDINTQDKAIQVTVPPTSVAKAITWTIGGSNKQRWAEFSGLGMVPNHKIRMRTLKAGYKVVIENDGPPTGASLKVNGGKGAIPVDIGHVDIPSGISEFEFELPRTTLTISGLLEGNNGWLVEPVLITLNAVEYTGKGFDAIEYSFDGTIWHAYNGPFLYDQQGETLLYYRSRDKLLNQELAKMQSFRIDSRDPIVTGSISRTNGVRLAYQATDPVPGSGVRGIHTLVQGTNGPLQNFLPDASGNVELPTTCSHVEFWAEDLAGNLQESPQVIRDSRPPVVTVNAATISTTHCTADSGLTLTASATDDCGVVSLSNDAPAQFPLGTTLVTWTAIDADGNVGKGYQTVIAELGDDPSCCPAGSNIILGTPNNDTLNGTDGNDCIIGLGGQDILRGFGGADAISGGEGDDQVWGGNANDWLYGGSGQDRLYGEGGDDILVGNDGVDWIYGGAGDDQLWGGQGGDRLFGEAGNDTIYGGPDDDQLNGGVGNDYLNGEQDNDSYNGGGGSDQCVQDGGDTLQACMAIAP